MISNGKKALIHVAKSQLGLSDAEYQDILAAHGNGARSSRDLNDRTFSSVLEHFEHLGFKKRKRLRGFNSVTEYKKRLMSKINAMCLDMNLPRSYVDSMAQRMCGADMVEWCDPDGLRKIVAALTYHQRRARGKRKVSAR